MCVHLPTLNKTSDINKIAEKLDNKYTDMDSISEFTGFCRYLNKLSDLDASPSDLKLLHLNIRSLLLKQRDLLKLLVLNDIDVCVLCETWLNASNEDLVYMEPYIFEGTHRSGEKKGGGVGILIAKTQHYK